LYNAGFSAYEIEDLLGVPVQTRCNWLEVIAEREVTALGDAPKSGRPSRLSTDQWTELTATLHASLAEVGYDDHAWSPEILRSHILDTYVIGTSNQGRIHEIPNFMDLLKLSDDHFFCGRGECKECVQQFI